MTERTTKTCPRCKRTKPLEEFYRLANRKGLGVDSYCKRCRNKLRRASRKRDTSNLSNEQLFRMAARLFGREKQIKKMAEECSEFCEAWFHYEAGRPGALPKLIEELAGVFITAWQVRILVGKKATDAMIETQLAKMERQVVAEYDRQEQEATAC